jgi:NitT/TauT family transport system substrate-binding protein
MNLAVMKRLLIVMAAGLVVAGCGQSYKEKREISRQKMVQQHREDSAALKVAVMPTMDCLPLFVASERGMFGKTDVRLRLFTAQMDCDTAVAGGSVQGTVTDLVRAERLMQKGTPLKYITTTNAYWQLFTNRTARIKTLKQLDDKMVAMTRYSVTDLLADRVRDSAKLDRERLFKIQVNDVNIRLKMLQNSEIDAALLTEPQAMLARLARHTQLMDTRKLNLTMGAIAFREKDLEAKKRQQQLEDFKKGYNMACDSLTKLGIAQYRDIVVKYCGLGANQVDSLPRDLKFRHIELPAQSDIERAQKWLKEQ